MNKNYKNLANHYKLLRCFIKIIFILNMIFLICPLSYGAVITVGPSGNYQKIQDAINASNDGDEVIVSQGKYNETIKFNGKNIIIRSTDPSDTNKVATTIIDGNQADSVVTFSGTELTTCVLSGFTITNGKVNQGGGIFGKGSKATIQNNTIKENYAFWSGGGIDLCNGFIQNNTIMGNFSEDYGGGLFDCSGSIQNNIIIGNSANYGGGLCDCKGTIQNNTITGNSANYGGGLGICRGFIINCIIWDNSATTGPQIHSSSKPFYCCIQNWDGSGRGNISDNPGFVDPANKNFHLQPDSPCIDKGNTYYLIGEVFKDMDGECRIAGISVDMGADEYGSSLDSDGDLLSDNDETTRSCSINNQDTDGDGLIDGAEVLRGTNPLIKDLPSGILIPSNYSTIQQGIFMAFPGENVTLSSRIYDENLYFGGKNIVLQSTNPLDVNTRNNTIIDGNKLNSVISLKGVEDKNCIIQGLTIRNGYIIGNGGGICGGNYFKKTFAIIQNNTITGNSARLEGGGLSYCNGIIQNNTITGNSTVYFGGGLSYCNGVIQNNTIIGNSATSGGGLSHCNSTIQNNTITGNSVFGYASSGGGLSHCDGIIQNNIITENSASYYGGGGLYDCDGTIQNNTIKGNSSTSYGGGLGCCDGTIQNNVITGNFAAASGGGLSDCSGTIQNDTITSNSAYYYGGGLSYCEGTIRNCIIWGNSGGQLYISSTPSYSCIQDWGGGGTENINSDPQFVDPTTNNYHLKSSSPCIDAGCLIAGLTQDFEGEPRPYNGTTKPRGDGSDYDIGADEYIFTLNYNEINNYLLGKTSPPQDIIQQMDVNNDSKVDIADVVYFILHKK